MTTSRLPTCSRSDR